MAARPSGVGPEALRPVDELAAPVGRLDRAGSEQAVDDASAAAGLETEASSRSGTGAAVSGHDVESDILPPTAAAAGGRRVEVLVAADRTRMSTPALGDLVVAGG